METTARSKLNLYLKVTAKRPDGYHELCSVFLPLDEPHDRVEVRFDAGAFDLTVSDPALPGGADNLAGRAALEYARAAGVKPDWAIALTKSIPVAAGMGGGSSDAAAVLTRLNAHYGRLDAAALAALALRLGADVPYFLAPAGGIARGVGERFAAFAFPLPDLPLLIVNPRFPVSAKWAYSHLAPGRIGPDRGGAATLAEALREGDPARIAAALHNDLAFALYDKFPLLGLLRGFLRDHGALNAEITGSGPTLYAIAADRAAVERLREDVLAAFGDALDVRCARVAGAGARK